MRTARRGESLTPFMPHELAYTLGLLVRELGDPTPEMRKHIGDEIDRGLMLRRRLDELGLKLVPVRNLTYAT